MAGLASVLAAVSIGGCGGTQATKATVAWCNSLSAAGGESTQACESDVIGVAARGHLSQAKAIAAFEWQNANCPADDSTTVPFQC
jgi:hypothetical protein